MRIPSQDSGPQIEPHPLSGSRSRVSAAKWILSVIVLMLIIALVAVPLAYRSMRPQLRENFKRYLPAMAIFDPQRTYAANALPTVEAPSNEYARGNADISLPPPVEAQGSESLSTPVEQIVIVVPSAADTAVFSTATVPTSEPTNSSLSAPEEAPSPTAIAMLPRASRIDGFQHIYQGWNNCGPATITMALTYYGWAEDQDFAAGILKPDSEDKNVSPWQMVRFVNENTGVRAITRMGGELQLLRQLINAQFPVIIETGFMPEGYDWMGHYRLVIGYDDTQREFYVYDSFLGHNNFQGLPVSFDYFDERWQDFNRTYIIVYETAREAELRELLGDDADLVANAQNALDVARQEVAEDSQNPFAWFNMGTSYLALDMYQEAAAAYDQARNVGSGLPWRMLWYQFGLYEAYYQVGRYDDVLALAQASLGTTTYVEETYYWLGMVYRAQNQIERAVTQFDLGATTQSQFHPSC